MISGATDYFDLKIKKKDLSLYESDIIAREELINRSMLLTHDRKSINRRVFKINVTDLKQEEVEDFMRKIKEDIKRKPNG